MSSWSVEVASAAEKHVPTQLAVRRHLHQHPDLSGQEQPTAAFIAETARRHGLSARLVAGERGVLVEDPARSEGRRVAIRADVDALRIQELSDLPFRSCVPGVFHACGHDGHSAVAFGAALILRDLGAAGQLPDDFSWRIVFQPAEETSGGALEMIAEGALEGVDAIFACHVDPSRRTGHLGVRYGVLTAACDELEIRLTGQGGHAARPHESRDPLAAGAQFITSAYLFMPRTVDSHEPVVLTFGQFTAGENHNVIPEEALIRGTLRSLNEAAREATKEHLIRLAEGLSQVSGVQIQVTIHSGSNAVRNHPEATRVLHEAASTVVGADHVQKISRASMGSEDFAFYLDQVPGSMFRLGCAGPVAPSASLHSGHFRLDEAALPIGAQVLALAALRWQTDSKHPLTDLSLPPDNGD